MQKPQMVPPPSRGLIVAEGKKENLREEDSSKLFPKLPKRCHIGLVAKSGVLSPKKTSRQTVKEGAKKLKRGI